MKKACKIMRLKVLVLISAACLYAGSAFAGFYVIPIPVETKSDAYVLVRANGTDTENGAALRAALDKITDAGPTKMYLVMLEPGTYDVGSTPLTMKSFVFVYGFGPDDTTITGNVEGHSGGDHPTSGVVIGADFSVLANLAVENTGGVTKAVAVFNKDIPTFFRMTHLNVSAEGGTTSNYGVYSENAAMTMENVDTEVSGGTNGYGVYNVNSSPTVEHMFATSLNATNNYGIYNTSSSDPKMKYVTVSVTGGSAAYAVYNDNSSPELKYMDIQAVEATVNYGIYQNGGKLFVENSSVSGNTYSVYTESLAADSEITHTELGGPVSLSPSGNITCKAVSDENENACAYTCPPCDPPE